MFGWTIRACAHSRRWVMAWPIVTGFGASLAQWVPARDFGRRSKEGHLANLLVWTGVLAALSLLTAGVWWLLPMCLPVSFALRLQ